MEKLVIPKTSIQLFLTNKLEEIADHWKLDKEIPVLLSKEYLQGLVMGKPDGMELLFGCCMDKNVTKAVFHLQIVDFDAEKRLRLQMETGKSSSLSDKIAIAVKLFFARKVNLKGSILGNLMTAGPYGIAFSGNLPSKEKVSLLIQICQTLSTQSEFLKDVPIAVIKDLNFEERINEFECKKFTRFYEFTIQPSMRLLIRSHWSNIQDYQEDLESKYRNKLKKALKLSEELKVIDADLNKVKEEENKIFSLYKEVAESVGFNLVDLKKQYLFEIKKAVGDQFKIKLIYRHEELIAFYSYFEDGSVMNAHFVGYHKPFNKSLDLYYNILVYYLKDAIEKKATVIEFARTALEIKSSLGAIPIDYYCYIAHKSSFINRIVPSILDLLKPVEDWKPRSPFKN